MIDTYGYPKTLKTKKKGVVVRKPVKKDTKKLLSYINALVEEEAPIFRNTKVTLKEEDEFVKKTLEEYKEKIGVKLVVFYGDELIATAGVRARKERQRHVGGLGITVKKDFRNEGVGTLLMKEIMQFARPYLKIKMIVLTVFADNNNAIKLYKNLGFKKFGQLPNSLFYKGKYKDEVYMYLRFK